MCTHSTPATHAGQITSDPLARALAIREQTRQRNQENLASIRALKVQLDGIRDNMRVIRDHLVPSEVAS